MASTYSPAEPEAVEFDRKRQQPGWTELSPRISQPPLTRPVDPIVNLENKDQCLHTMHRQKPVHREDWQEAVDLLTAHDCPNIDELKHTEMAARKKEYFEQMKNETARREITRAEIMALTALIKKSISGFIGHKMGKTEPPAKKEEPKGYYE